MLTKSVVLSDKYLGKMKQSNRHKTMVKVLDMCCGKGGDLLKWKKAGISHLICADVAEVSLEQCRDRYNDVLRKNSRDRTFSPLFTAEFVTADCTKVKDTHVFVYTLFLHNFIIMLLVV